MDNNDQKIYKNKRCKKALVLIPHDTNLNNLKSNDYFVKDESVNSMKEALTKYREKYQKNDTMTKSQPSKSNSSTIDISNFTKQKYLKNNTIKVDKILLNCAEPRTKVTEFFKIQPKIIDSVILDQDDNINSFYDNENKLNKNIKRNNNTGTSNNRYKDNNKLMKNNNRNVNNSKLNSKKKNDSSLMDYTNDNDETIINENEDEESISFYKDYAHNNNNINNNNKNNNKDNINNNKNSQYSQNSNFDYEYEKYLKEMNNKNSQNNKYNNYKISGINLNVNDINCELLLMNEKLFNDLNKDLEINKMGIYQNKLSIIKDFLYTFNDKNNYALYTLIEKLSINNYKNVVNYNRIGLIIKEYIILQLIFFYTIILIALIRKDKNIFQSGLHNLSFYFHQNYIAFLYIIIANINSNSINDSEFINDTKKLMNILDENKTWLDKNTFNNYLQTNNKLSKQTLINVIKQIKNYFDSNPFSSNQKENSKVNQNENDFVESCIEIFLLYLNSYQNFTIINIINEIKNSAPIIYLLEMVKFNKVLSHYNEIDNEQIDIITTSYDNKNDNESNEEEQKEPYLKPINPKYIYTLVLDLDETLVHFISNDESDEKSAYIQIRPGAEEFIKDLSEYYEIVIFTAAHKNYADLIIDALDPDGVVSERLYRQHTLSVGNVSIKDLSKLGRDLKHVIIIDNCVENFSIQPDNGLNIIDFEGFEYDDELEYIKEDLLKLAKLKPDDVRYYLKDIQLSMNKRAIFLQKVYNQINDKNELINDNNNTNNLFKEVINNNINNKITDKLTEKIVHKGYSYTEESENVVE